jgi:hypothetical protein
MNLCLAQLGQAKRLVVQVTLLFPFVNDWNAGFAGGLPLQAWRLASCNDCQAQLQFVQM